MICRELFTFTLSLLSQLFLLSGPRSCALERNANNEDRLALNSQVRFQRDLEQDNLITKVSNDYDGDGVHEVYWKTSDNTAYLRALMHDDGNIRYANYQNESQMIDYLTTNGLSDTISEVIS